MPADLVSVVPQLVTLVEKLGIIGILILGMAVLVRELMRVRREAARTYRQRDKARTISARYKTALDMNNITVDISDIEQMFKDDEAEAKGAT